MNRVCLLRTFTFWQPDSSRQQYERRCYSNNILWLIFLSIGYQTINRVVYSVLNLFTPNTHIIARKMFHWLATNRFIQILIYCKVRCKYSDVGNDKVLSTSQ